MWQRRSVIASSSGCDSDGKPLQAKSLIELAPQTLPATAIVPSTRPKVRRILSYATQAPATRPATGLDGSGDDGKLSAVRQRFLGVAATILAELFIIALLLTLGWNVSGGDPDSSVVTTFEATSVSPDPPSPKEQEAQEKQAPAAPEPEPETQPPQPQPDAVPEPQLPAPPEPPALQMPNPLPSPAPAPAPSPAPRKSPETAAPKQVYGPPDTGSTVSSMDSQRVGTAPNGEPMYAARWYRRPTRQELTGYLSTARAPSSALIVCRTVPDFYVEDCELLSETPPGSQIGRAVMAATWQFRVRPAIVGGRSQVGSWVRIRIDYTRTVQR